MSGAPLDASTWKPSRLLSTTDRRPCEMGSLSCKVQRDSPAPGNHQMHQTPSCLSNKRTVWSTKCNNRLTFFSALGAKTSVGGGGYLYFLPGEATMRQFNLWGLFLSCFHSWAVKSDTHTEISYRGMKSRAEINTIKMCELMAEDSWQQHGLYYWTSCYRSEPETWGHSLQGQE